MTNRRTTKRGKTRDSRGFSLTESVVTVAITGTLAAIATPVYLDQAKTTCQRKIEGSISAILSQAQAYNDEYKAEPKGWSDLDKIATIMTSSGPAIGDDFSKIIEPTCNYQITGASTGSEITLEAFPRGDENEYEQSPDLNVVGCINLGTGASDLRRSINEIPASISDLNCK